MAKNTQDNTSQDNTNSTGQKIIIRWKYECKQLCLNCRLYHNLYLDFKKLYSFGIRLLNKIFSFVCF